MDEDKIKVQNALNAIEELDDVPIHSNIREKLRETASLLFTVKREIERQYPSEH